MKKQTKDIYAAANAVSNTAPLQTKAEAQPAKATRAKSIKAMPVEYFEAHAELRENRKTSLDFTSYIIEAVREKLERDAQ